MKQVLATIPILILLFAFGCGEASVTDKTDRSGEADTVTVLVPEDLPHPGADDPTATEAGPRYIEGEFTVEKAMEVVYGLYDKNMECSKWVCKVEEQEAFSDKMDETGTLFTKASRHFPFETGEGKKVLLVTATAAREGSGWESCHACAPILGLAQFGEIEGDWFVEGLKKNLGTIGSWGELPDHELISFGPGNYGLRLNYGYTQHGITSGGLQLIGMVEGKFTVLLDRVSDYSNDGYYYEDNHPELRYSYQTEINFADQSEGQFRDLLWTRTGSQPTDGGKEDGSDILPFEEKIRFIFDGKRYSMADSSFSLNGG